jgi:hypothetical protein
VKLVDEAVGSEVDQGGLSTVGPPDGRGRRTVACRYALVGAPRRGSQRKVFEQLLYRPQACYALTRRQWQVLHGGVR